MDCGIVDECSEETPPWENHYGCRQLLKLGNQGIIVNEDGSKTVVKVAESSNSVSSMWKAHGNVESFESFDIQIGYRGLGNEISRREDLSTSAPLDSLEESLDIRLFEVALNSSSVTDEGGYYSKPDRDYFLKDAAREVASPFRQQQKQQQHQQSTIGRSNTPPTRWRTIRTVVSGNLCAVLSAIYCIFLVTVGVVIGVADLILPETNVGEVFSIYLLTPGLVWYVVLHVDLRRHNNAVKKLQPASSFDADNNNNNNSNSRSSFSSGRRCDYEERSTPSPTISDYTFRRGRHSGSFFLKIGAAGFCFGHLIHSCLMLGRQILHFTSDDPTIKRHCADKTALVLYLLLPIYSFYQLFILFKYSNVMINRWNELARFALMHSIATSLFFWFWSVRNETVDSLHHRHLLLRDHHSRSSSVSMPYIRNSTEKNGKLANEYANFMAMLWNGTVFKAERCAEGSHFSALILRVSPYLYPFSIEYSILVVGIWFIMWQNVGKAGAKSNGDERGATSSSRNDNDPLLLHNHLVVHADCSSANRGLFAGLVVMVATAVSIIVFFLASSDERYTAMGIWISLVSESALLVLMIVATGLACRQLGRLDVNADPISQLDDLLLFVCIPSFFLYGIFSAVPAIAYSNYMALFGIVLQVLQVLLQTPTIIDGLRRCSYSEEKRSTKPGRELVTFLVVCNLSMWIMETLEIKSYETNRDRIHFYGRPLWTLLSHVTLPLTLFYRFHSASCLADIWKSAYEAPEH